MHKVYRQATQMRKGEQSKLDKLAQLALRVCGLLQPVGAARERESVCVCVCVCVCHKLNNKEIKEKTHTHTHKRLRTDRDSDLCWVQGGGTDGRVMEGRAEVLFCVVCVFFFVCFVFFVV